ncbi:MAG: hypothetical protein FJY10_00900 [Bacteroidetes bacterium]|nr:hypothetical protein [Bacteroidota bacterium]
MCLFFETMRVENGIFRNLENHLERMNRTRREVLGLREGIDWSVVSGEWLVVSGQKTREEPGVIKCRVVYGRKIEKVSFEPYVRKRIDHLALVHADELEYPYKYLDRSSFERILCTQKGADDVLIIKNGLVTDTSFTNVAFLKGKRWYTPAKPLLPGTQRQFLLDQGLLEVTDIGLSDIPSFSKVMLFNAMFGFGEMEIPIGKII